ncbi:hypothetical protein MAP00_003585 [Monascus purpureus]|nr:hypothetical protein MAP00_003585 [Monascus purpureus]
MALRPPSRILNANLNLLRQLTRKATAPTTQFVRNHSSVSEDELSHFSALGNSWWDPVGPSRALHLMNPLRHEFIASCLADGSMESASGKKGLKYLDVGCGGGIFAESMARRILDTPSTSTSNNSTTTTDSVLAIDPSPTLIQIAKKHARTDPLIDSHLRTGKFTYRNTTLEELVAEESSTQAFDVVTLFEVLEHIDPATSSPVAFLGNCLRLLRPGGWLVGSTIARSLPSFVVNQVIAEAPWPVGVVPRGTHEWSKFVNPDELRGWVGEASSFSSAASAAGENAAATIQWKCMGVMYIPCLGWRMVGGSESWGNYFWAVRKGI